MVALILVWSAYVAEVYRAGIESVHPARRRPLARSAFAPPGLRFVVLPQAVRRVIPPLLNDFIGLQKDTALVSFIGVVEVFRQPRSISRRTFNFTPYLACALLFLLLTIPLARFVDWLAAPRPAGARRRPVTRADRTTVRPPAGACASRACTSPSARSRCCAAST